MMEQPIVFKDSKSSKCGNAQKIKFVFGNKILVYQSQIGGIFEN